MKNKPRPSTSYSGYRAPVLVWLFGVVAVSIVSLIPAKPVLTSLTNWAPKQGGLLVRQMNGNKPRESPQLTEACGQSTQTPRTNPDIDNPLWMHFDSVKTGPLVDKWTPYFDIYHRYFRKWRGKDVHFVEVGVQSGGSIGMWRWYFGDKLKYYGIDINPYTKELFEDLPNIQIFVGSQSNRTFWQETLSQIPQIDIFLDDGGHTMEQQITTFEEAYSRVEEGGVYIVEDTATSYVESFGGGRLRNGTFIEYAKRMADEVNGGGYGNMPRTPLSATIVGLTFYEQMVVFERGHRGLPRTIRKGTMRMAYNPPKLVNGSVDPRVLAEIKRTYNRTK